MIIDTHAHLYYDDLINDIEDVLQRANEAGVERIIVPAVDLESSEIILKLAEKYSMIYAALGFHPCDIKDKDIKDLKHLDTLLNHDKVVAIGEIGLDYHWDTSYNEKQKEFFKTQIEISIDRKLPVIIHTRNSTKDAVSVISEFSQKNISGQFHCFSGDGEDLENILGFENFFVSFCGNLTYKKFESTNELIAAPVEKMLLETDSPFLTPEPFRGRKKNEPSFIVHTADRISEIKNIQKEEFLNIVYTNSIKLFFKK